jgi:hypothetical protein
MEEGFGCLETTISIVSIVSGAVVHPTKISSKRSQPKLRPSAEEFEQSLERKSFVGKGGAGNAMEWALVIKKCEWMDFPTFHIMLTTEWLVVL